MVLTRINSSVAAVHANRNLGNASGALQRALERLSSGLRVNRAADDAAGLSISERQRSQIRGLNRAVANAQDAIGLINTAEGALQETANRLQRIRELSVAALNRGGGDADAIQAAQDEIETAIREITRIGDTTQFSTRLLLNGANANVVNVAANTPHRGLSLSNTPVNSNLPNGISFLRMTRTVQGSLSIDAGPDGVGNVVVNGVSRSTFGSGDYALTISNVLQSQRQIVTTESFARDNGGAVNIGTAVNALNLGGIALENGDVLRFAVTLNDGTVRDASVTVTAGLVFSSLLTQINTLLTDDAAASYFPAIGTSGVGVGFRLTAGYSGASQLGIRIGLDTTGNGLDDHGSTGTLVQRGQVNQALVTLDGGRAVSVQSGSVVTLYGREEVGGPAPQAQFSFGRFASDGTDILRVVRDEYSGALNNGREVRFGPGDRQVLFRSGLGAGAASGDALVLDIGANVDLGASGVGAQGTVMFSSVNQGLTFQIGAGAGQNLSVALADLRASNLGFPNGLNVAGDLFDGTVDTIDVRSRSGAENAIRIVDEALSQVSRQRSFLGATSNRLGATISNLGVASENLTAAESRIRDADIARETTEFTRAQIQLQAAAAILGQANLQPHTILRILFRGGR